MSLEENLIETIKSYNMDVVKNDNKLIVSRNNVIKTDNYALNLLLFGNLNG
jgi:hypothetical protein